MATADPFADIVKGYPKLAAKFEVLPEVAIFRRFGALNAQNLLYYQAELASLEIKLREQQVHDSNDREGKGECYATNWHWLKHSKTDSDGRQLNLIMQIRELLKQYSKQDAPFHKYLTNKAIIQQATILGYPEPGRWDLHHVQDYLQTDEMGTLPLEGDDSTVWGTKRYRTEHKPDLIVLKPRAKKDAFSVWAAESTIFNLFKCGCSRFMKPSPIHGTVGYEDSTIYRITYWFTNILASLIPILSIVVLYQVQSMSARLGIIAAFNILVSICLMSFANAKRAEVFAISAAFAAVQVVFVSAGKSTST
ncbi:hypothetical protein GQ44DRAFT_741716 [Phaeosphaeriaceae sp. PMI808]|nr:hypothetical protein GQ44DRAFT_741716 [Phaeosphaeriaceae sp. PMI808]